MSEQVTKEQYEFFRALYDEEERTSLQLEGRAKVYLGVISALLAALLLKADDAQRAAIALHLRWSLLLLSALPMTAALPFVLWALRIRNFEAVSDGPELLHRYENEWPAADKFFEDRAVDFAVASATNRELNNEAALLLSIASWCITAGVVYFLIVVLYAIWRA